MKNFIKSKWGIITIIAVIVLSLAAYLTACAFDTDIYKNVYVGDVNLGGLSTSEAQGLFELEKEKLPETVTFTCSGEDFNIYTEDFDVEYNFDATVKNAYEYGRDKNFFKRFINVLTLKFSGKTLPIEITFDTDKLNNIINEKLADKIIPVVDYSVELVDDQKLVILNGTDGYGADMNKVYEDIKNALSTIKTDEKVEVELGTLKAKQLEKDAFFADFLREPEDAYFTNEEKLEYVEHVVGIEFDKADAEKIISENRTSEKPYEIPVKVTYPEITLNKLLGKAFEDILGSYATNYNPGEVGRTKNVSLAASKVNGVILAPGENFSFNKVVGARTYENGFRDAKVYQGNEIVDGLGGGICQVSSTLYNAVLYANLEIVTRRNHSLSVAYVPLGRDATVSYGSIDFVFKNNKKYPIKLTASAYGGRLSIAVMGVKDDDTKVELYTETVATRAFEEIEEIDPELKPGETKIKQNGSNGYTVNTYKVVKSGGTSNREFVSRSVYLPTNKITLIGAEETEETDSPANGETDVPVSGEADIPSGEPSDKPNDKPNDKPADIPADIESDKPSDVPSTEKPDTPEEIDLDEEL